ncbi:MAG: hypothetical protein HC909_02930 [Blastochloris sp.]|nr:hypothetical protein [Blastochloris sp.]
MMAVAALRREGRLALREAAATDSGGLAAFLASQRRMFEAQLATWSKSPSVVTGPALMMLVGDMGFA